MAQNATGEHFLYDFTGGDLRPPPAAGRSLALASSPACPTTGTGPGCVQPHTKGVAQLGLG